METELLTPVGRAAIELANHDIERFGLRKVLIDEIRAARELGVPIAKLARDAGVSAMTIREWLA